MARSIDKLLGRKLTEDEVVHHVDCNTLNNKMENLEVMTKSEHSKLHKENINITRDKKGRIISYESKRN